MHMRSFMVLLCCALLIAGSCYAAPTPSAQDDGGLEQKAQIGAWVTDGKRGGALRITGEAQKALDADAILQAPQGSCSFLLRLDKPMPAGGVLFATVDMALVQLADSPYLEFRVGDKAVRKTNYDWLPGDWHHVILSWDHGTPAFFLDGKTGSAPAVVTATARRDGLYLGSGAGAVTFDEIFTSQLTVTADGAQRLAQISLTGAMVMSSPTLSINRTTQPPTFDGVLSPGEWDHAAGFTNVVHLNSGVTTPLQTSVWLTYDDKNLYLAAKMPVIDSLDANITKRDDAVFADNSIEMFFMPNPSGALEYYQMVINALGTQFDGKITDVNWNGSWQVKTHVDTEMWTSEVVIPLADINARTPKDGDRWKMNICPSPAVWSFTGGSYHNSSQFGMLKFRDTRPVVRFGAVKKVAGALTIPYTVIGDPRQELVLRADTYQTSGIRPAASTRTVVTRENLTGELVLQPVNFDTGVVEMLAFDDPSDPITTQIVRFNPESFKPLATLKAQADAQKPLFRPKVTVVVPVADTTPKPAAEEYRPSLDTIEEKIVEQQLWLGNGIGKNDGVPKPWTPMVVNDETVACWAKEFQFARGAGLPQQVKILDADEFTGPLEFVSQTKSNGKRTLFVKENRDSKVTLVGRQALGDVGITTETTLEFDGFARVEVTLSPNHAGAELDGLTLKLPFKKERATYYTWWDSCSYARPAWEVGNFITGKMQSGFEASVWIGDDDRGMCWFAEAPQNWSHPDDKDIIEIVPGTKSTDLLIHFLKGKQTLDKPLKLVFGYMATPAKPRPADWRNWEGTIYQIWDWFTVFSAGYPPVDIERFRQQVKNPHALPMLSVYFAGTCFMKDGYPTPEQWLWNTLWSTGWDGPRRPHGPFLNGNPKSGYISYGAMAMGSSWPDYYMYKLKEMREKYGLRSVYLDTCVGEVNNPFAGMTWKDQQGKVRGKVDLFAFREATKRIYNYIHEDPEGHVQMHQSNQVAIPILSFVDTHMNGEHFNTGPHQVGGRNYSDVLPIGTMRACYTLRQWGVVPNMLPEWPASTRGMMGYFWVHDGGLNGAWCDFPVFGKAVEKKKSFGLVDVNFLPYWQHNAPAAPQPNDLYISAYEKTDKSAVMLIIANMQKSDTEVQVVLNEQSLGWPLKGHLIHAVDMEFGATFQIRDGKFSLPVKTQDFRMIKLTKE